MTTTPQPKPGDQARATVLVAVPLEEAFRVFTQEIDLWWRRGLKYRVAGKRRGIIALEGHANGRLFESFADDEGREQVVETGRVTHWDPPHSFRLTWRNIGFAAHEQTQVEVNFVASASGTQVSITHSGWADIRADHPARHGMAIARFVGATAMWWGEQLTALRLRCAAVGKRGDAARRR